jgi:hypothetical protein
MQERRNGTPTLLELIYTRGVIAGNGDIDRLLLESLDQVLDDLLGKKVREAFYDYMETKYYIGREEVPNRLNDFLLILERSFGKSSKTVERTIARRLCTKIDS